MIKKKTEISSQIQRNKLVATREERDWGMSEIGEETKSYKLPVIKYINHGNVKYSIRNIVNNTIVTLYG